MYMNHCPHCHKRIIYEYIKCGSNDIVSVGDFLAMLSIAKLWKKMLLFKTQNSRLACSGDICSIDMNIRSCRPFVLYEITLRL